MAEYKSVTLLTFEQENEIVESVAGGCQDHYGTELMEKWGFDPKDLEEVCAKYEQFKCPNCGWWTHQGENLQGENELGESICGDCAEDLINE